MPTATVLITGATGTGKTVTLQILAESFSNAGVPVFCADVKGDLSGIAAIGEYKDFLEKRAKTIGLDPYEFQEFPVIFWDLFGEKGHPSAPPFRRWGRCCWRG
jgi:DNA helicase HerA-like ATPase